MCLGSHRVNTVTTNKSSVFISFILRAKRFGERNLVNLHLYICSNYREEISGVFLGSLPIILYKYITWAFIKLLGC